MDNFTHGLELLFQPQPLMWLVVGVSVGFVVGVLPGLSTSNTAAILLPFSIGMPLENSLVLIVSIYAGAAFGGAIPAILFNVPGEAGSAVTALDGYPLAKRGQGGLAIGIARMASVLGGVFSGLIVLLLLAPLGSLALKFGAREMFVVVLLGFVVATSLMGSTLRKGLLAGGIGLMLATVGVSAGTAEPRFTFGNLYLYEGIPFLAALIGLFALSEMLILASEPPAKRQEEMDALPPPSLRREINDALAGVMATLRQPGAVFRASTIGLVLGVIPGIGTSVANFVSYGFEKRRSKNPSEFGKGSHKGIIASEACDNAVTSATLVPTLTLGIPGSATMAVVLAAFYLQGIQPGPRVLQTNGAEAYAVVVALILASILILPLGVILAAPMASVTRIPLYYLVPGVIALAFVGVYAVQSALFDVGLAVVFGIIGVVLRRNGYPVIPLVLGLILGPLAEKYLTRSMDLSGGEISYFFGSPLINILWAALVVMIAFLIRSSIKDRKRSVTPDEDVEPALKSRSS